MFAQPVECTITVDCSSHMITFVAMPSLSIVTHMLHINTESTPMKRQQCIPFELLTYMSLSFTLLSTTCIATVHSLSVAGLHRSLSTVIISQFDGDCNFTIFLHFHIKSPIFLSYFNQIWIKVSNKKFQEKLSNGSQVDTCRWMDRHVKANRHFSVLMQTCLKIKIRNKSA